MDEMLRCNLGERNGAQSRRKRWDEVMIQENIREYK